MLFGHSVFCDESDKDGGNGENGELVFVQIVRKWTGKNIVSVYVLPKWRLNVLFVDSQTWRSKYRVDVPQWSI